MTAALAVRNACKTYADGFTALDNVSLTVEQGEFFALLGPNGAGKTTLISAAAGLNRLTSGSIAVMGHDVAAAPAQARTALGVVPQELVYDPFFNVREVLRIQSGYFGIRRNDAWIDELLNGLGLSDKAHTNMRRLSGGMKRRVMVAQALVHKPPVIILDEPTAGVDVELRHSLWAFMRQLNRQGHTVILTTHYLEEAEQYCNRIAVLKRGRLAALDSTRNLLAAGRGVRIALRLNRPLPERLAHFCREPSEPPQYILTLDTHNQLGDILAYLKLENIDVLELNTLETDLEDVFMHLTAAGETP